MGAMIDPVSTYGLANDLVSVPFAPVDELATVKQCPVGAKKQLLCLHNHARKVNGVAPLKGNPLLYKSAELKIERMIECMQFSHTPCGDPFTKVFDEVGYKYTWAGENAAYGYPTIRLLFAAWLSSEGHRNNIIAPYYTEFGSAFRETNNAHMPLLWVVDFAAHQ